MFDATSEIILHQSLKIRRMELKKGTVFALDLFNKHQNVNPFILCNVSFMNESVAVKANVFTRALSNLCEVFTLCLPLWRPRCITFSLRSEECLN